jgi:hypothetical protein
VELFAEPADEALLLDPNFAKVSATDSPNKKEAWEFLSLYCLYYEQTNCSQMIPRPRAFD